MTTSILVVGGAGYIGSHMVKMLLNAGYDVTVFDNLSRGHRDSLLANTFVQGDLLYKDDLAGLFRKHDLEVVMHFAGLCNVEESMFHPNEYYQNNVVGTLNLLESMIKSDADKFILSSSCATYGEPQTIPITEEQAQVPINPYGRTKLIVERMLRDYGDAYGLKSISLRYFNAAGCDPDGVLGERHEPETHLIPLILKEARRVQQGEDPAESRLCIYGSDFDTKDGTCVRDFIHVQDLCSGHLAALELLLQKRVAGAAAYNLGTGTGFSIKEVIEICKKITGIDVRYRAAERRLGDPPSLVGNAGKATAILG